MGRPPKASNEKRQQIGARFSPEDRARIDDWAEKAGRSAGAEVERRVLATLDLDDEGLQLIEDIGREIVAIQRGLNGKRWHKSVKVWSAVAHMLRTGPIMEHRPEDPMDDEAVQDAYRVYSGYDEQRRELVSKVASAGVAWLEDPMPPNALMPSEDGIFGRSYNALAYIKPRERERRAIEALDDDDHKDALLYLHGKLCELDEQVREAKAAWVELLSDHWNEESEGHAWSRQRQMEQARQAKAQGRPYSFYHLTGVDPWTTLPAPRKPKTEDGDNGHGD